MEWIKGKPPVEIFSFNDIVEYGLNNGANIENGMPWSFNWRGIPVTHENDNCYLLPLSNGEVIRLERKYTLGELNERQDTIAVVDGRFYLFTGVGRSIRLPIKFKGLADTIVFSEYCWNFYKASAPASHIKVKDNEWQHIEWLSEGDGWISVEKELPEKSGDPIYLAFHKPQFEGDYNITQCGFTSIDAGIWPHVTHWMPLPQNPKA